MISEFWERRTNKKSIINDFIWEIPRNKMRGEEGRWRAKKISGENFSF